MRQKYLTLKITALKRNMSFCEIARHADIHTTRMSQIANGWVLPRDDEKRRIAEALGVSVAEIFPNG